MAEEPYWLPDSRRIFDRDSPQHLGCDVKTKRYLGAFLPDIQGESIVVGPEGRYRGSANIDQHIVYVAQLEDGGNATYTPVEFAERFNWKNDPSKARYLKLDDE